MTMLRGLKPAHAKRLERYQDLHHLFEEDPAKFVFREVRDHGDVAFWDSNAHFRKPTITTRKDGTVVARFPLKIRLDDGQRIRPRYVSGESLRTLRNAGPADIGMYAGVNSWLNSKLTQLTVEFSLKRAIAEVDAHIRVAGRYNKTAWPSIAADHEALQRFRALLTRK